MFFYLWVKFWVDVFSYCSVTDTFAFGFQSLFHHEWINFGVFCWNLPCFANFMSAWTEFYTNCSNVVFLTTSIFSIVSLRVFWSVLQMRLYFLIGGFSNTDWWALATRLNCTANVPSTIVACTQLMIVFWHGCNACKSGRFYTRSDVCKKVPHAIYTHNMQFTRKNW